MDRRIKRMEDLKKPEVITFDKNKLQYHVKKLFHMIARGLKAEIMVNSGKRC